MASTGRGTRGSRTWLTSYVNLTRLRDAQTAGRRLLLGVSERLSPEEVALTSEGEQGSSPSSGHRAVR